MRRFENPAHREFWDVWIERDRVLAVRFGRSGTPGLTCREPHPSAADADRALSRRVEDRRHAGFAEVNYCSGWIRSSPPPRPPGLDTRPAVEALAALRRAPRSWQVAQAARRVRRALAALGPVDPADHPALAAAFDELRRARPRWPQALVADLVRPLAPAAAARVARQLEGRATPSSPPPSAYAEAR